MNRLSVTSSELSNTKQRMLGVSERLKEERKRLGLSQEMAANALGISVDSLYGYEKNKTNPPVSVLLPFSDLGADVLYIVTGQRSSASLPEPEQQLITAFRSASAEGQSAILTTATALSGAAPISKKPKSTTTQIFNGEVGQNISGGFKGDHVFHFGKK
ncbi:helix-turn-helix transcriptional regulator [Iodobacter sp. CM08]|uniref:helix-turn-helix domain-containing protein n=1 Tax=Iodobacter sp. CM08 TaxID=3085902 RepID=UPI002982524C|nr:helix-turn-helix transcriptional regulator [Iodobacter sp. CM08]MDW5416811.1 helix-turn-helix transcriptional regulator [Iodobacter sp. CM08]